MSAHRRELLLLAYLAARPRQADTRVALATLLWEDRDDRRARASLRQALFRLRGALPDVLVLDGETVALAPGRLWTDAGELLRLAGEGALDVAIACWTGDFLAGEEPPEGSALREWATAERESVRAAYRRLLDRRIVQAESAGAWGDAVAAAERLAALDPLDPAAVGRLAAALRRAGDPAGALARIDALAARRRAELDAGLPPRLTALREELRAELAAREAESARAALRQPAAAPAPLPAVGAGEERARLLAAWRHVADGADPILVTGAEAAGRSALLAELQAAAAADGALVLAARGYEADREVPWATARLLLAPLADAPGLAGLAPAALARLATVVPAVRDAFPALPVADGDDWAVLDAVRAAVEEVATEVPVLVAVDDLPRADARTRQLVLALARRLPVADLCVAATARDDELPGMPEAAALLDVAALHRVALAAPDTPTPAEPATPIGPRRPRRALLVAGAALGVALLAGGAAVRAWRDPAAALDASLVAVAPFDVADADLTLWRHGMVDVLARRLDGAGPLRTVPPTTVIRRFEGRGDPAGATALGTSTGAGLVVYGGIVHAGADSVRLEARLFDVRRGEIVGEVRVHDALAAMDRAIDALGIGVLRELARTRPMGAVRTAGIEATSLPALRAFLAAEQHYRAGAFQAAAAEAERALALDSGFALARHRLGTLLVYDEVRETGARHLMRAAEARAGASRRLSPRDSTVLALDSLRGAALLAGARTPDGVPPAALAGPYLERLRRALLRFSDDPELRLAHAEALVHMGAAVRSTHEEQYAAYERAIALDTAFFPAYVEAIGLALATHRAERALQHLATMRALARQPQYDGALAALLRVARADGTADTVALARWLRGTSIDEMATLFVLLGDWPDPTAASLRLLQHAGPVARRERPEVWTRYVEPWLRARLDQRGRLAERRAMGGAGAAPEALVRDAILGAIPAGAGDSAAAAWLASDAVWTDPQPLAWLAARGDSAGLRRYLARVAPGTHGERLARAYLVLTRRDTAGALTQLRATGTRDCPARCLANDLLRAQLLVATGAIDEARALLAGGSAADWLLPATALDVRWLLERARAAERAGDPVRAAASYRSVAGLWASADAALQPLVAEARAGLQRTALQRTARSRE